MDQTLKKAIKERDDYLKEHPEHQWFQDEIDQILSKTPDHMRLEVLKIMLMSSASKLKDEMIKLHKCLVDVCKKLDKEKGD